MVEGRPPLGAIMVLVRKRALGTIGSHLLAVMLVFLIAAAGLVSFGTRDAAAAPIANNVSATVAWNSGANTITLNITGEAATSVAIGTGPTNGAAIASGTSITYQPNPGYAGPDSFTYTATNGAGTSAPATVTITVTPPPITITSPASGALPTAMAGTAYNQTFTVTGGTAPNSVSLTAGALPVGMSLSSAGTLSGTPTTTGTFNFTLTPHDSSAAPGPFSGTPRAYSLTVLAPTLHLSPETLPAATTGQVYSQTFSTTGGAGGYTYSLTSGSLPIGVAMSSAGALSGTPLVAGSYSFAVKTTDSLGFNTTRNYTVVVADPVIVITSPAAGALPPGTAGTSYSATFVASGGVAPNSISITSGSLPIGMSLSSAGVLSGTPLTAGTFNFTLRPHDSSPAPGPFTGAPVAYSLTINAPTLTISPPSLPSAIEGIAYSQTFATAGGAAPYSYSLTAGSLPIGMSLSSAGVFSGTPLAQGSFSFTLRSTDTNGFSVDKVYTISVGDPTVAITSPAAGALPAASVGTAYAPVAFSATGGNGSYSFAVAGGALPAGMTLTPAGALAGTPTTAGSYNFSVVASDTTPAGSGGPLVSAAVSYTLVVEADAEPPVFTSFPADQAVEVDHPAASAIVSWAEPTATDNLPGVTVTRTAGPASGTAFALGTTIVSYEARDAAANTVARSFAVTVTQRAAGRVTMIVNSPTDGTFSFSSPQPALNFAVATHSGSGTSGAITVPAGSHAVSFTVPAGFGVASASCTDAGSSLDAASRSGTLTVTPGADLTCTIAAADISETTGLIGSFMEARSRLILANQPDADRRVERLTGAYNGQGGVSGFGLGFSDSRMPLMLRFSQGEASFAYSMRRATAGTEAERTAEITQRPGSVEALVSAFDKTRPASMLDQRMNPSRDDGGSYSDPAATPFDIWVEGKFAKFNAAGGDGRFGIVHAGFDYLVTPNILVGVGGQVDWTDFDGSGSGQANGTGYLIGPYATVKLSERFFFDARAAWGRSDNEVSPFGTYTDKLDAGRWLVSGALIGRYDIDRWLVEPSVRVSYFEEESDAYVDSLGFNIPGIEVATGTLEFGPKLSYRMELGNDWTFEPFLSLQGIWTFEQKNTASVATETPGLAEEGLRGRGELGLRLAGSGATSFGLSTFYDGIGGGDFEAWGGEVKFNHSF